MVAVARATRRPRRSVGSIASRTSGVSGGASTSTSTGGCSGRCSTARPSSSRERRIYPPAHQATTRCWSRARTSRRNGAEWAEKSLMLAAIGEARDRGAKAIEAFAYGYEEDATVAERYFVHRTIFPRDFLDDFGFTTLQNARSGRALSPRARRSRTCRGRPPRPRPPGRPGRLHRADPGAVASAVANGSVRSRGR